MCSQYTQNSQRNIEMIKIITYSGQYKADFIRLNTEWIETYFSLEGSTYDRCDIIMELKL